MKFILNKDKLEIENIELVKSGSISYYEAEVEYDESWKDLVIEAVMVKKDEEVGKSIAVINNKMYIDQKLKGTYCIGFVGYKLEEEKKIYQVSTNLQKVYFDLGAGEIETENADTPTPTEWEIYLAEIKKIVDDVSDEVAKEIMSKVQSQIDEIEDIAKTAESIAKGANQSLVYGDYSTMITAFDTIAKDTYKVGQNILIITLNVPDLWISEVVEESVEYLYTSDNDFISTLQENGYVQIGHYKLSALETQKVDLANYISKDETEEEQFEITYKDGTTKTVRSVVYK